jgi:Na+/H+-dicarboxylate symporter/ABC-type amino acid transport substrate-binding protein
MTFSRKILLGLVLGVATGIFLGDRAAPLRLLADGFIRLLQMTVLPYVTVSLIAGIGGLDAATARRLFLRVGALTLVLWGLALGAVFLMPLTFPPLQSASFFSTTMVEERASVDFLSLYIPSNPFNSLANSVVPAVVLFSGVLGIALMGVPGKERLIEWLQVVERALARANRLVVRLTPLGLFAIAAHAAGTLDLGQVARLRVYLIAYGAMALLLSLWVFPGLVACLTPIPARRVLQATQDVLITAFMTADLFIVLPTLIDRSKQLLAEAGSPEPKEGSPPDVIVPAFYNFPHAAKMLSLSFVLFAAWYSETTLTAADYPRLTAAGVVSLFGSINVSLPFLLDFARVPADTFQLFVATGVLNSRFGTLAAAMHMVVLALVGTYVLSGRLRLSGPRVVRYLLVTAGLTAATLAFLAIVLRALGGGTYEGARLASEMGLLRPASEGATVLPELPAEPPAWPREGASILEAARARGRIRVGFIPNQRPYSHFNGRGELVGFDVEMAHALARELGIAVEFAPVPRDQLVEVLERGRVDVVMAGVLLTTRRASRVDFSAPYLDEVLAFVVPDHRRAEFSDAAWVRSQQGLRVGVPDLPYVAQLVAREFPNVTVVPLPLNETEGTLTGREGEAHLDAVCLTAERGSFLTLLHPAYSVAVPHPLDIRLPLAYPVARHDLEMARFLGLWIDLKRRDGTIQALYDHWILGKDAKARRPRWSILRDVLGWER